MRRYLSLLVFACAFIGCAREENDSEAVQGIAGPGGVVVTAPVVGQQVVTWTADPLASKYYVYQSTAGGALAYVASVLDPSHPTSPPAPTSYTATGIATGVQYCYAIASAYGDGSESDIGASGCSPPPGCTVAVTRVAGLAVKLDIVSSCSNGDGWSLSYRLVSNAGGLASSTVVGHPCGSPTHVEMLITGQLPLLDLVTTGWIFNAAGRIDCTVTTQ